MVGYLLGRLWWYFQPHFECTITDTAVDSSYGRVILDSLVIILSIIFIYLCGRSLFNTLCLAHRVRKYFKLTYDLFRWKILIPLVNFWHVGAIISNLLVLVGSIMKISLTFNVGHPLLRIMQQ